MAQQKHQLPGPPPNPFALVADYFDPPTDPDRERWAADPVAWVHERLGEETWSKQREILESIRDNRRTAVHSCHESGKSWIAGRVAAWWIETHPPGEAFVVTSAPTGSQVKAILWREIGRVHARGKMAGRCNQTEWWMQMPAGNEEIVAYGRKPDEFDPAAFQGIHARYVLVIFDEAAGIPQSLWEAGDTLIANEGSAFLAIGNPDHADSEFAEVCKPGSDWNVIGIDAFETPNFTDEAISDELSEVLISPTWVDEKRKSWGEENPLWIAKIRGQFPDKSVDGLIPISWVRNAQQRSLDRCDPRRLGMDVGGGGDLNVIADRAGPVVRIVLADQQPDTMKSCGNLIRMLAETEAPEAYVDVIGIGKGVVDRAQEQGKPVTGVNVGDAASDKEAFVNLRAEGWWGLRERFQSGEIDIDEADDDLAAQLCAIKFKVTSRGKIQIESKDEMKRRGVASPDRADAVMLAFIQLPKPKGKKRGGTWGKRSTGLRGAGRQPSSRGTR